MPLTKDALDWADQQVHRELTKSIDKYGPLTSDPIRGMAIITQELGEAAEAALNMTRHSNIKLRAEGYRMGSMDLERRDRIQAFVLELAQVAQLCLQMIMRMEEEL
jgi:hypothetical protein